MNTPFNAFDPFESANPDGSFPALLVCDHAVNAVPTELRDLGLDGDELARHIGWDPGARAVTLALAEFLDAPALLAGYSRLVIDPNRPPDSETSILECSDGTVIPGNIGLDDRARSERVEAFFLPYHRAIDAALDEPGARFEALICVHSFTPVLTDNRLPRPWHASVLWAGTQQRFARRIRDALAHTTALNIGENVPYVPRPDLGYTADTHGELRGLPNVLIEIRQDLLEDDASAGHWAGHLADILDAELGGTQS